MNEKNNTPSPESIFEAPEEPLPGAITSDADKVVVETDTAKLFDHSEEIEAVKNFEKEDGTLPPDLPEHVDVPINNTHITMSATDEIQAEMERRFSKEFGDLKVEVTQQEKDAFVRAALNDSELIFTIDIPGVDAFVDVALPSDAFTTLAASIAHKWMSDGDEDMTGDMQWVLNFQQIHVWFQIRAVSNKPTPWSVMFADGVPKIKEIHRFIKHKDNLDDIVSMPAVKWRLLIYALRVAEYKYKICLENWRERTFFTGADTV